MKRPQVISISIIADNYVTHKRPAVTRWLDRHARFHMHYTPTSSSWMNLVERFFRDLTEFITEKSFASTRELRKIDTARRALAALQPASNPVSETAH
jgi:DDE superfamily endonuclease